MIQLKANWPVIFRALLYFAIAFLGAISDKVASILEKDAWPTPQRVILAALVGTITGLIALRAYYDGTAQRHEDSRLPVPTPPPMP